MRPAIEGTPNQSASRSRLEPLAHTASFNQPKLHRQIILIGVSRILGTLAALKCAIHSDYVYDNVAMTLLNTKRTTPKSKNTTLAVFQPGWKDGYRGLVDQQHECPQPLRCTVVNLTAIDGNIEALTSCGIYEGCSLDSDFILLI